MARKRYEWNLEQPPELGAHSLAKHRILHEYLREYVRVLTSRTPGMEALDLAVVDGFCGGGRYRGPDGSSVDGSPFIALNALREAEVELNQHRRKPIAVRSKFYFVDENASAMAMLRCLLDQRVDARRDRDGAPVRTYRAQFEHVLQDIITDIRGGHRRQPRVIFILDQYGYTDVKAGLLGTIFEALPRAEAFVTVAVGWIAAYLKDVSTIGTRLGIEAARMRSIAKELDQNDLDPRNGSHRDRFFVIQRLLRDAFVGESSMFYTPFFIVSRESNRAYWLLHLANNETAHDVVKSLHWRFEVTVQRTAFANSGRAGPVDATPNRRA